MPGSPSDLSKGENVDKSPCRRDRCANIDRCTAIGWTLTGTMNSPNTSLAWHYPTSGGMQQQQPQQSDTDNAGSLNAMTSTSDYDHSTHSIAYPRHLRTTSSTSQPAPPLTSYPTNGSAISNHDATDLLMSLSSPYQTNSNTSHHDTAGAASNVFAHLHPTNSNDMSTPPHTGFASSAAPNNNHIATTDAAFNAWSYPNLWNPNSTSSLQPFGDMMIESQDVDMSMLGLDMMPWFDSYPSHDYSGLFDPNASAGGGGEAHNVAPSATSAPHGTPQR